MKANCCYLIYHLPLFHWNNCGNRCSVSSTCTRNMNNVGNCKIILCFDIISHSQKSCMIKKNHEKKKKKNHVYHILLCNFFLNNLRVSWKHYALLPLIHWCIIPKDKNILFITTEEWSESGNFILCQSTSHV